MKNTIAFLLACAVIARPGLGDEQPISKGWDVVVRPISAGGAEAAKWYWVGLKNMSGVPRAFCALGVRFIYDLQDGSTVDEPSDEYPGEGSAHPCSPALGHLLLPGETYFVRVQPELPKVRELGLPVRFKITGEEVCVDIAPCKQRLILTAKTGVFR